MHRTSSTRALRALAAAIVAAVALVAFGLIGGIGFAGNSISGAQYQYDKVTICHVAGSGNLVTITVAAAAVPAHLRHGDTVGPCP